MKKFYIFIICLIVLPFSDDIYDAYKEHQRDKRIKEAIKAQIELQNSEEYKAELAAKEAAEEEERMKFRASISNKYPYEGLPEEHIDYTVLGPAHKSEKSLDFYKKRASRRSTKYVWYTSSGKVRAIATASYWDYETDEQVPGYISRFQTYFEEGE